MDRIAIWWTTNLLNCHVCKKTAMNPKNFMHPKQILDGLGKSSEIIHSDTIQTSVEYDFGWCRQVFWYHPPAMYGLGRPSETIPNLILMHKLIRCVIFSSLFTTIRVPGFLQKNSRQEFTEFTSLYRRLRCDCASWNRKDELYLSTVSPQQMCAGWDDQTR